MTKTLPPSSGASFKTVWSCFRLARRTEAQAQAFGGIATGRATPLRLYVDQWLAEGALRGAPLKERTKAERRRAVDKLAEWMVRTKIAATVEAVTRRVAGRYVSDELIPSGRDPVTLGKSVRSLSSYWAWLQKRGRLPEEARNPWSGQAPQKRADDLDLGNERAFTDGEVVRLLASPPNDTLADFMLVGALTGMRREEIGQLQVADCADGVFIIQRGKTAAARRRVPIHPDLADIVNRRSRGKPATAYLFHELASKNVERTDPIGKAVHPLPPQPGNSGWRGPPVAGQLPQLASLASSRRPSMRDSRRT